MKKQIFLLSVGLFFASYVLPNSCNSSCSTTCATSCNSSCNTPCVPEHGKTRFDVTPHWQNGSAELTSLFNSDAVANLNKDDKHGIFQVSVFGGKSTKCNQAAGVWLPYGHTSLTFDGSIEKPYAFAQILAESDVFLETGSTPLVLGEIQLNGAGAVVGGAVNGLGYIETDAATYSFDSNKDTSKILPWNFGITYAALFEPRGASAVGARPGTGLITSPTFKSTVCPTYQYSHVGAGLALRYHFSEDKAGWFGFITTAVQHVNSKFRLNENVITEKTELNATNFPVVSVPSVTAAVNPSTNVNQFGAALGAGATAPTNADFTSTTSAGANPYVTRNNIVAAVAPTSNINGAYLQSSGFPTDVDGAEPQAPANVEQAFAQDAWNYGKVCGCEKITRLADIELALGYQWNCGDCAETNWYFGVVIPTGNKAKAEFIAPAVVGNGQHAGVMVGSQTDVMLSDSEDYQAWYRCDMNFRYLFRNTQKASFDLLGNEWSRYMMVWENKAAYTAAVAAFNSAADLAGNRNYTPGINVFTTDFYIKPQFQGRVNQAVNFQGDHFRAELGWNTFARQKDCVQLACDWTAAPAFADSSYVGGIGLNNNRTIYNDAQTTSANQVTDLGRSLIAGSTTVVTVSNIALSDAAYDDFAITEAQINYDSVATPAAITQTPYLVLGYAFESDWKPVLSVGASYEFTQSNRALNQWLVWGKFEIGF